MIEQTKNETPSWEQLLIEAVTTPGKILDAYRLFHNYSLGNALLALIQCSQRGMTPGPINTYQGWKEMGRQVQKGQKALSLVMPITCKKRTTTDDAQGDDQQAAGATFTRFALKPYWFVLSQTEGAEVAKIEAPGWDAEQALATLGVTRVDYESLNGNAQGYAMAGKKIAISPFAAMPHKTMFHEMAHVLLGHTEEGQLSDDERTPRSLREAEAESVALLCCASLQLEGQDYARGYIQNWLAGAPIPEKSA
jgi:antirestriction protein ArdC